MGLEKKYVARQLAVLLYEASNDLPNLLGKEFRGSLKTLLLSGEDLTEFNRITKNLNQFKKSNRLLLNELRNFVGAHRDNDAGKQLEIIEKIDLLQMMGLAGDLYAVMNVLIPFLTKLTLMLGDWQVLIKHMPMEAKDA